MASNTNNTIIPIHQPFSTMVTLERVSITSGVSFVAGAILALGLIGLVGTHIQILKDSIQMGSATAATLTAIGAAALALVVAYVIKTVRDYYYREYTYLEKYIKENAEDLRQQFSAMEKCQAVYEKIKNRFSRLPCYTRVPTSEEDAGEGHVFFLISNRTRRWIAVIPIDSRAKTYDSPISAYTDKIDRDGFTLIASELLITDEQETLLKDAAILEKEKYDAHLEAERIKQKNATLKTEESEEEEEETLKKLDSL